MKIAVNTRFLIEGKLEGIGIYTQEILKRVVQLLPQHEFYFLFDRKPAADFIFSENVKPIVVSPQARHPFLWYWWFEKSIPAVLKKNQIDVFFSTDGYGSLSTTVPQIITQHDLAFEHFPEQVPFLVQKYYRYFVPRYCKKAAKLLAVSNFTKKDIVTQYSISPEKIEVVYNGFNHSEYQASIIKTANQSPYFIFIGAVHPRKNVLGLLKAFEEFKSTYQLPHQLKIIGRKAWMNNELDGYLNQMQFKSTVEWYPSTTRNELLDYLKNAQALVYPSFFEGFGIPVLEAMSLGVPVITSNLSSLPEVAGDAALLINPYESTEIVNAMYLLATDQKIRMNCIEKGKERASAFSWDISAKKVADILEQFQLQ